jgi:hypothetical protein
VRAGPAQPAALRSAAVAVTAGDRDVTRRFGVARLRRLSASGIVVWVTTVGRNRQFFMPMPWPPRLSRLGLDHRWEGQPASSILLQRGVGAVRGWDLDVRIYFATQSPGPRLLAKAQRELDRLLLPRRR